MDRPSREPPETRKANQRRPIALRRALATLQAAERALLRAVLTADAAAEGAALAGVIASRRGAGLAEITARYRSRRQGLDVTTARDALPAAHARLAEEEAAEIAAFNIQIDAEQRQVRRRLAEARRRRHHALRAALHRRQTAERIERAGGARAHGWTASRLAVRQPNPMRAVRGLAVGLGRGVRSRDGGSGSKRPHRLSRRAGRI